MISFKVRQGVIGIVNVADSFVEISNFELENLDSMMFRQISLILLTCQSSTCIIHCP